jgi:hypothetical protein
MFFSNRILAGAFIPLPLHRAEQITVVDDPSIAFNCLVKVLFLKLPIAFWVVMVDIRTQEKPLFKPAFGVIERYCRGVWSDMPNLAVGTHSNPLCSELSPQPYQRQGYRQRKDSLTCGSLWVVVGKSTPEAANQTNNKPSLLF